MEHELAAFVPSQAAVDEKIDVNIRVEDLYHNIVESWFGDIDILDENGVTVASGVQITSGTGSTQISLTAGYHRLRLAGSSGQLTGRSNPVKVTTEKPEQRLFWADLHGHTSLE